MIRHSRTLPFHSRFSTFVFAMAITLMALTGCNPAPQAQNTFVLISKPSFVKSWESQIPVARGDSIQGIYLLNGTVHVLTQQNFDHALKSDTGDLLYLNRIGTPDLELLGGPASVALNGVPNSGIVFGTTHTLELYTQDGLFQKSMDVSYRLTSPVTAHQSLVFMGLEQTGGRFACVDITRNYNPIYWDILAHGDVKGHGAIVDNVVYYGSEDGSVTALLSDKTAFWPLLVDSKFVTGGRIVSDIVADHDSIYFASGDGQLYCLDRNTGKIVWRYFSGNSLETPPVVTTTSVYQYVRGTGLVAIDKTKPYVIGEGESLDQQPVRTARWIARHAIRCLGEDSKFTYVLSDTDNVIAALDRETGNTAFIANRRNIAFITSDPKDNTVYGVTRQGLVVAIKPVVEPGSYGALALNEPAAELKLMPAR